MDYTYHQGGGNGPPRDGPLGGGGSNLPRGGDNGPPGCGNNEHPMDQNPRSYDVGPTRPWIGPTWNLWYSSWYHVQPPIAPNPPLSRKSLPYPIYIVRMNLDVHVCVFCKAI
jgi:hypothetical protein